jgi:HEAT repeat protein
VEALIEALKDNQDSVRSRAAEALEDITKEDFGQNHEDWTTWYEKHR